MAVAQEAAQHAETPNVTPGTSASLPDHSSTSRVPVTTEKMCPTSSEEFFEQPADMPGEESRICTSAAAVGVDKGDYAHKGGMNTIVDIAADCSGLKLH